MQKGLKNLDAAGKNVLDASKNVDALMGGFMKKGLNVNVKDAKNVMNAVSVSAQQYMKFSGIKLSSLGHIKGRRTKEPDSKAVCRAGERPGRYQAVLPRRRKRSEDVLREQVAGVEVPATRTLPLHPDYRRSHQELCLLAKQSRSVIKMLQLNEIYITVPVVLVEGKGTTPKKTLEKRGKEKNVSFHPQKSENLS